MPTSPGGERSGPLVRSEELVLDRLPVEDDDATWAWLPESGPDEVHDFVLHEEVPDVGVKVVAHERVRLRVRGVHDHVDVAAEVGREEVVVEVDGSEEVTGPAGPR